MIFYIEKKSIYDVIFLPIKKQLWRHFSTNKKDICDITKVYNLKAFMLTTKRNHASHLKRKHVSTDEFFFLNQHMDVFHHVE